MKAITDHIEAHGGITTAEIKELLAVLESKAKHLIKNLQDDGVMRFERSFEGYWYPRPAGVVDGRGFSIKPPIFYVAILYKRYSGHNFIIISIVIAPHDRNIVINSFDHYSTIHDAKMSTRSNIRDYVRPTIIINQYSKLFIIN